MNKVVLVLFVTSVALGAVTLHLVRELRGERALAARLEARIAELERPTRSPSMAPSPGTVQATPATVPPQQDAPAPAEAPKKAAASSATMVNVFPTSVSHEERVRMMRDSMERQRALLRDPEYREAMHLQQKAMLPSAYPDLALELGLSSEETEAFMSLLADQQVRAMEHDRPFFEGQPDPATMQEISRKAQEWQTTTETEIRNLLGAEKWRAWNEYRSTMGVRSEVAQLRQTLAMKGAPLEDHQVKPLQRALIDAQQRQVQEWNRSAATMSIPAMGSQPTRSQLLALQEDALRRQREHHESLRNSLGSVLTGAQLRHLEEQHEAQLKMQEAHLRMMRAQAEAEASGQVPPPPSAGFAGNEVFFSNGFAVNSVMAAEPAERSD